MPEICQGIASFVFGILPCNYVFEMHDCEVCASREDVAFCSRNSDLLRDIHPIAVVVAVFFVQGDFDFFRLDNLLRLCAFAISP